MQLRYISCRKISAILNGVQVMKILTLNTHSLQEENYAVKLEQFIESILKERPDIIALQEVNQTAEAEEIPLEFLKGQYPVPGYVKIRKDNHAAVVAKRLNDAGIDCYWAWLPIKRGYAIFDEGVAVLSLGRPITAIDQFPVSHSTDYQNWRTRAVLGIQVEGCADWFYSVHMGWWDEEGECFQDQWKKLQSCVTSKRICNTLWLMGDFNAPDAVREESYDLVLRSGWMDTYQAADEKDCGITVPGVIDGWREKPGSDAAGMRLDYIWCSEKREVLSSRVVFNGKNEPIVSDHFGVMAEIKE